MLKVSRITTYSMLLAFAGMFAMAMLFGEGKVLAAPAGCYTRSVNSSAKTVTVTKTNCPTATNSTDAARYASGCWVSSIIAGAGQSNFASVDCSTLTVGTTSTTSNGEQGCYIRQTTATSVTTSKTSCPNANSTDAAKYASGCWVSSRADGVAGQTSFSSVDCSTIILGTISTTPPPDPSTPSTPTAPTTPEGEAEFDPIGPVNVFGNAGQHICGSDGIPDNATADSDNENEVHVTFDFGCRGDGYPKKLNPILDIAFAIFRFLSAGVGLVVVGSIIIAGIQYSASAGNPQATQAAKSRIATSVTALLLFIFIFAIANYLVPGGLFAA